MFFVVIVFFSSLSRLHNIKDVRTFDMRSRRMPQFPGRHKFEIGTICSSVGTDCAARWAHVAIPAADEINDGLPPPLPIVRDSIYRQPRRVSVCTYLRVLYASILATHKRRHACAKHVRT